MEKLLLDSIKNGKKTWVIFSIILFANIITCAFCDSQAYDTKVKSANDKNNTLGKLMAILQFNLSTLCNETSGISNIQKL